MVNELFVFLKHANISCTNNKTSLNGMFVNLLHTFQHSKNPSTQHAKTVSVLKRIFLLLVYRKALNLFFKRFLTATKNTFFQSKKFLLNLGRYHRHTGVPSDYFGVMGTIFLHAVRYHPEILLN